METITIPKETFEKMRDALVNSLTFLLSAQSSPQLWHDTMDVVQETNKAEKESALQRVADLGQEIEAGQGAYEQKPKTTNCRHCGGPDNVVCAGQCKNFGIGAKP